MFWITIYLVDGKMFISCRVQYHRDASKDVFLPG